MTPLSDIELGALAGAFDGPARNHASVKDAEAIALWDGLVEKGYAALLGRPKPGSEHEYRFYKVTEEGYAAVKAAREQANG